MPLARVLECRGCAGEDNSPTFALSMVAVGLAAPAAFSGLQLVAGLSIITSYFYLTAAVILRTIKLVLGFRGMMDQGTDKDSLPTLWIVMPILTVLTITLLRQGHALHAFFGGHAGAGNTLVFLSQMLAAQMFFGLLGWVVMRRERYFEAYIVGPERSPAAYALTCPGTALAVMAHFFINKGLVAAGLVAKFEIAYWNLSALAVLTQLATIWLVVKLNLKLLSAEERRMTGAKRKEVPILIVNPGSVGVAMQRHATYMTSKRRTDMGVVSSKRHATLFGYRCFGRGWSQAV